MQGYLISVQGASFELVVTRKGYRCKSHVVWDHGEHPEAWVRCTLEFYLSKSATAWQSGLSSRDRIKACCVEKDEVIVVSLLYTGIDDAVTLANSRTLERHCMPQLARKSGSRLVHTKQAYVRIFMREGQRWRTSVTRGSGRAMGYSQSAPAVTGARDGARGGIPLDGAPEVLFLVEAWIRV